MKSLNLETNNLSSESESWVDTWVIEAKVASIVAQNMRTKAKVTGAELGEVLQPVLTDLNDISPYGGNVKIRNTKTYDATSTVTLPANGNMQKKIKISCEEGTYINQTIDYFLSLTGASRIDIENFNVLMGVGAKSFLKLAKGGDNYTLNRCRLRNLYFLCNQQPHQVVLDLHDIWNCKLSELWWVGLGEATGDSIALHLACNNPTNQGTCTFDHIGFSRAGEAICIKSEGITGARIEDVFTNLIGYDLNGDKTTYAIQCIQSGRHSFLAPTLEMPACFSFDANSDMNTIVDNKVNVNVLNNGTNTRIMGGNFLALVNNGSMQIGGVNWINALTVNGSTLINDIYSLGSLTITGTPTMRLGSVFVGRDDCTITSVNASPATPSEPTAGTKGASNNPCFRNKTLTVITAQSGLAAGYYYAQIYSPWANNQAQTCKFNVRSLDTGDADIAVVQVANVRDAGSSKILFIIHVLSTLAADHKIRVFNILE